MYISMKVLLLCALYLPVGKLSKLTNPQLKCQEKYDMHLPEWDKFLKKDFCCNVCFDH